MCIEENRIFKSNDFKQFGVGADRSDFQNQHWCIIILLYNINIQYVFYVHFKTSTFEWIVYTIIIIYIIRRLSYGTEMSGVGRSFSVADRFFRGGDKITINDSVRYVFKYIL